MADERFSMAMTAFNPTHPGDLILERVIPVGRLARVGITGLTLARLCRGDIDVMRRRELDRVFTARDLVIVKRKPLLHFQPRIIDEHRDRAMVGVVVDRPVGEYGIRLLGFENLAE